MPLVLQRTHKHVAYNQYAICVIQSQRVWHGTRTAFEAQKLKKKKSVRHSVSFPFEKLLHLHATDLLTICIWLLIAKLLVSFDKHNLLVFAASASHSASSCCTYQLYSLWLQHAIFFLLWHANNVENYFKSCVRLGVFSVCVSIVAL